MEAGSWASPRADAIFATGNYLRFENRPKHGLWARNIRIASTTQLWQTKWPVTMATPRQRSLIIRPAITGEPVISPSQTATPSLINGLGVSSNRQSLEILFRWEITLL